MPSDNKNQPPNTSKDEKISELPNRKASQNDQDVKGGAAKKGDLGFEPVNG